MREFLRLQAVVFAICLAHFLPTFVAFAQSPEDQPSFPKTAQREKYVPGRVLVRFRTGKGVLEKAEAHAAIGAKSKTTFNLVRDLELAELSQGADVMAAVRQYRQNPDVLYAEPDYRFYPDDVTPTDPLFPITWGLKNTGQNNGIPGADIGAGAAWQLTTGNRNVVVGVIDTGVAYTHPDLAANMCQSQAAADGSLIACKGINVVGDGSFDDPWDWIGHGTHVAGTIGALGNDGTGVAGVNWQVSIVPCKFIGWSGGSTSGAIQCLEYMASLKDSGLNLVATNNSWGGGFFSQALYDAVKAQMDRGILFIAAAGNSGVDNDVQPHYPSSYDLPNIISVAASDRRDRFATFSNFGRRAVHISAPGVAVLSTVGFNSYVEYSGTSMATPHVTGAAALLKAYSPSLDWKSVKNLLLAGSDSVSALAETATGKRLNAYGAMTCTNQTIFARQMPRSDKATTSYAGVLRVSALHIDCGNPAGTVTVTVQPGGSTFTLLDDGIAPDLVAGDGLYTADWAPPQHGAFTLHFPDGDVVTVGALKPYSTVAPTSAYRTIGGTSLNLDDDETAALILPFPIRFGGVTFDQIFVSDNGIVTFDNAFNFPIAPRLPYPPTGAIVAPFWDDLEPIYPTADNVFWEVLGSAPSRELVVEWRAAHYPYAPIGGGTVKFQVVFFEDRDDVIFNYSDVYFEFPPGYSGVFNVGGNSAGVGIQVGPTEATQYSYFQQILTSSTTIQWQLSSPDFSFTLPPTPQTAFPGVTANFTGTVQALYGLTAPISISCIDAAPQTCIGQTLPANPKPTNFTIQASDPTPGKHIFTLQAQSPGTSSVYYLPATLDVVDFSLGTPSPATIAIANGGSGTVSTQLYPLGPFSGQVSLSCAGLPLDATCIFTPSSPVTVSPGGAIGVTVTISLAAQTVLGNSVFSIVANTLGAPAPRSINVDLTVQANPDFFLKANPTTLRALVGGQASGTVGVFAQDGYTGTIGLSCAVTPPGPACSLGTSSVSSLPGSVGLTVSSNGAPHGLYQIRISANDGNRAHTVDVPLRLVDYSAVPPATMLAYPSVVNRVNFQVSPLNGYRGVIRASCDASAFGAGAQCSVSPDTVDFSVFNNGYAVQLSLWFPTNPSMGATLPLIFETREISGPVLKQDTVSVTVRGSTLTVGGVTDQTILVGDTSGPFELTLTPYNDFDLPVTLEPWSCGPSYSSFAFTPSGSIVPTGSPILISMKITVPVVDDLSFGGDFPCQVFARANIPDGSGNSIWMAADAPFNLHVQDFKLETSPDSLIIARGASGQFVIKSTGLVGFNSPATLSCPASLPTGMTCGLNQSLIGTGESAVVTIGVPSDLPNGFHDLEILGTATVSGRTMRRKVMLRVVISDFALWLSPPSVTVSAGGEAFYSFGAELPIAYFDNFPADVTCTTPSPGITCDASFTSSVPGFGYLTVRTAAGVTPVGSHEFNVGVTAMGQTQTIKGTIVMQGTDSLTVTAPNGFELWANGTQHVTWAFAGNPGSTVRVELLNRGLLDRVLAATVPMGVNGKGYYTWAMPAHMAFSRHYRIRVVSNEQPAISDESDERVWMGEGVDVIYPSPGQGDVAFLGEFLRFGYTWAVYGRLRIDLYKGGQFYKTLNAETGSGYYLFGHHEWGGAEIIPPDVTPGIDYQLKLVTLDDPARSALSGTFTVSQTSITVITPNGGEVWKPGTQQTVSWTWVGQPIPPGKDARIMLNSTYTIVNYTPIGANGSGSYTFTVPAGLQLKYYRLSVAAAYASDASDRDFAIGDFNRLTVSTIGSGWVYSSDSAISCGANCSGIYLPGSSVTLTAQPNTNNTFTGWAGACSGIGTCTLTVNSDVSVTANFASVAPDISVSASATSATVRAGSSAQFSITLTPQGAFSGSVAMSCTGLPVGAQCSFSPNNFNLSSNPVTTALSITTTSQSAMLFGEGIPVVFATMVPGLLLGLLLAPKRSSRRRKQLLLPILLALILGLSVSCGGGGSSSPPPLPRPTPSTPTPAGSYSVSVVAQSGAVSKTLAVTLVVQ